MQRCALPCLFVVVVFRVAAADVSVEYQYATIAPPGAVETLANGINNKGQVVGFYFTGNGDPRIVQHAFLLSGGTFTPLADPNGDSTMPTSINDAGQIAGAYNIGLDEHAFVLRNGIYSTVDPPARGPFASANGINNAGHVVGYYTDAQQRYHGFGYADGQFTRFDAPGAVFTIAFGINDAGDEVGQFHLAGGDERGFLLSKGQFTPIDVPGAVFTVAQGINNKGDVVGNYGDAAGTTHGFLLHDGVFTTLDAPGAYLTIADGINDAGQIVGWFNNGTLRAGFLATLVPEPGWMTLFALAGVGLNRGRQAAATL